MTNVHLNPSIFREYDVRGIAGKDLSPEFAHLLGWSYARYLSEKKGPQNGNRLRVSVGRDCRLTSDSYADALIEGIRSYGINVISLGVCPTPLTYFSVFHLQLDGGIMITGSHNPSDYNGFKICVGKDTLHGSGIQDLYKIMLAEKDQETKGTSKGDLTTYDVIPEYWKYIQSITPSFKDKPSKKIVLDAGNGTASTVAPTLFERLGAQVIPLFCELDGRFPNHHPDPTVVDNLEQLIQTVKKEKADFGMAFDGDSDRIGVVDENGRVVFGDEIMVILSRSVLKELPGSTIISEVKSSQRLYDDIAEKGGKPIMWKTGHSLIKTKIKETGAALAGEMSGHIFFSDRYFGYDDAVYAAVRLYEIALNYPAPFSTLINDLTPMKATPEIRVDCLEEKKFKLIEETKKLLKQKYETNDIDGVRVNFGDSWGLARASNTQPVIVLRFEAPTDERLKEIREIVESSLQKAAETVGHPKILTV